MFMLMYMKDCEYSWGLLLSQFKEIRHESERHIRRFPRDRWSCGNHRVPHRILYFGGILSAYSVSRLHIRQRNPFICLFLLLLLFLCGKSVRGMLRIFIWLSITFILSLFIAGSYLLLEEAKLEDSKSGPTAMSTAEVQHHIIPRHTVPCHGNNDMWDGQYRSH